MKSSGTSVGLGTILFIVFLILKLTGTIDWSWWWVTAPIWIPVAFIILLITVTVVLFPKEFVNGLKESIDKELKKED